MDLDKPIDALAAKVCSFTRAFRAKAACRQSVHGRGSEGLHARPGGHARRKSERTSDVYLAWQSVEYIVRCGEKNGTGK